MGKKECHEALHQAIQQNSNLEQPLPLSMEVDDWAQPEEEDEGEKKVKKESTAGGFKPPRSEEN